MLSLGQRVRRVRDGSEGVVHAADLNGKVKVQLTNGAFCNWQAGANFASLDGVTVPQAAKTLSRTPAEGGGPVDSASVRVVLDSVDAPDDARESALDSLIVKGKGAAAKMRAAAASGARSLRGEAPSRRDVLRLAGPPQRSSCPHGPRSGGARERDHRCDRACRRHP